MSYKEWRVSFRSSEQAARAAYDGMMYMQKKVEDLQQDAARFQWLLEFGSKDLWKELSEMSLYVDIEGSIDEAMGREE